VTPRTVRIGAAGAMALAIVLVLVLVLRSSDNAARASCLVSDHEIAGEGLLLALVGDNRLLRIALPGGELEAERRLEPRLPEGSGIEATSLRVPGPLLAPAPSGRTALVLVRRGAGRDAVAVVDPVMLKVRCRYRLTRGVRYRGLAIGPRSASTPSASSRPAVPRSSRRC
jgi:hypothetical protein